MANTPSSTMTRKIDFTTETVVWVPSNSALPFTARPFAAGDDADRQRHERRLDHADLEMRHRNRVAQPGDEHGRAHPAIEPGDQPAAVERGHGAEEGEDRQGADERDDPRQDQDLDRIEAHGAQRVDLLAHLHGAELGGVGAAGAAGDHDRHQQHADLAQHQDADHVDDIGFGAELAEVEDALLGDDAADQEGDQHHDRHREPADAIELVDRRGEAEAARVSQHAAERGGDLPQHREEHGDVRPRSHGGAADALERGQHRVPRLGGSARLEVDGVHLLDEAVVARRYPVEAPPPCRRGPGGGQALQQPSPDGVERIDFADVEKDLRCARDLRRDPVDQALQHVGMGCRPGAAGDEVEPARRHRAVEHRFRGRGYRGRGCHVRGQHIAPRRDQLNPSVDTPWRAPHRLFCGAFSAAIAGSGHRRRRYADRRRE